MRAILAILLTLFFIGCGSSSGGEHSSFNISNISPLIDVNDTYLIEENTREAFQVKATDNTSLKYYISGKDAHLLYIDTITGELFFNEPTNYEKYAIYNFILIAEDNIGNRTIKEIIIKIKREKKASSSIENNDTRAFITVWKTDNEGVSQNNQIIIPIKGDACNYTVEWGDGLTTTHLVSDATHTYEVPGIYTVRIRGKFSTIYFESSGDTLKLLTIEQWGGIEWKSMGGSFTGCKNLRLNATDIPNLSKVTSMYKMFKQCEHFNQDINNWDVSHVTNMSYMFQQASHFNQTLSAWDVSHVTNMSYMFEWTIGFNQNLNSWNVSRVINMRGMFGASNFNQPLDNWDVSHVLSMESMFSSAIKFNQNLNSWNVSAVKSMENMFSGAKRYNQNMSLWDVSSVINMRCMFDGALLFNQNISRWDTPLVTNMNRMFYGAKSFNHQDLSHWDVSNIPYNEHNEFLTQAGLDNIEPKWRVINKGEYPQ